jgi:hypothetical protein
MIITLTEEQLDFAHSVGFKRSASVGHAVTRKSFNAYENKKPDWWRHYIGALGELAYSIYIGKEIDTTTIGRGDDGTDFDNGVDVKSSDLNRKPNLLLGINQFNKKYAKRYVLAWVKIPTVELIGYIDRDDVINKSTIKNFGYNDNYFVTNNNLKPLV